MDRARIGDIEISVVSTERLNNKVLVTEKPVESGQDIADHIKKLPHTIELVGVVVGDDAGDKLNKLKKLQREGTLVKYTHRNALDNIVIEDISSVHESKIRNGYSFNMRLKHVRIAVAKEMEISIQVPGTSKDKAQTQVKTTTNNGLQQPKEKQSIPVDPRDYLIGVKSPNKIVQPGDALKKMKESVNAYIPPSKQTAYRDPRIQMW